MLVTVFEPFRFKMNGHLDPFVPVSVSNGFHHETVRPSGSSGSNYDSLIDLSPSRCRAPSNLNPHDVVVQEGGGTSRGAAYDSPSLPTNGALYRNSSGDVVTAAVSRLPAHYWTGEEL